MIITKVELLARRTLANGVCQGDLRLIGDGNEVFYMRCKLHPQEMLLNGSNAALASDALRQIKRLPEYRLAEVSVSPIAIPKQRKRRVIALAG